MTELYLIDVPKDLRLETSFPDQYQLKADSDVGAWTASMHTPHSAVDNHWLVWVSYAASSVIRSDVIGVTSHEENVAPKTYVKALAWAQTFAAANHCTLIDQTRRGKESKLAKPGPTGTAYSGHSLSDP